MKRYVKAGNWLVTNSPENAYTFTYDNGDNFIENGESKFLIIDNGYDWILHETTDEVTPNNTPYKSEIKCTDNIIADDGTRELFESLYPSS